MTTPDEEIKLESVDSIAVVTIDRERRRNALNIRGMDALLGILESCRGPNVSAIILRGAGDKSFCAGADVKELSELDLAGRLSATAKGQMLTDTIEKHPRPVIAAIEGFCLGGGLEIALACDYRIAGTHSTLGLPEVRLNALPTWGGTSRLPRAVGRARAGEMVVFGKKIDATTAEKWGLISEVVSDGKSLTRALELAKELADATTIGTVTLAKQLIVHGGSGISGDASRYLEYLSDMSQLGSDDMEAGLSNFKPSRDQK